MQRFSMDKNTQVVTGTGNGRLDAVSNAIKNYFNSPSGKKAVSISSFSSEFKYSGAAFDDANYVFRRTGICP